MDCEWITGNGQRAKKNELIEVEIKHYNESLNLSNELTWGWFGDDCFYLQEGGELSYNWNIIKWRKVEK
jgi:hypothetical protein